MLWEFSNNAVQTINPGESVIFSTTQITNGSGLVRHRDETGSFLLSGRVHRRSCGCVPRTADYVVSFGANIAIPTGGTVDSITVAITLDGATIPTTEMISTPAAVEQYNNVSDVTTAQVWSGCCETLAVTNVSNQPILMQNANLTIFRSDN